MKVSKVLLFCSYLTASPLFAQTIVIDNSDINFSVISGDWSESKVVSGYQGSNYLHDGNVDSLSAVSWQIDTENNGQYEVFAKWTAHGNRASNAGYTVLDANGEHTVYVNQKGNNGEWISLGVYKQPHEVKLSNLNADGYVIADSIKIDLVTELLDVDGDGITDEDELSILLSNPTDPFSLDPEQTLNDAQFDSDGDGFTNLYEIQSGTNPLDDQSIPPISTAENTLDGHVTINGAILLTPQLTQPFVCSSFSRGSIYYDDHLQSPMICNGEQWNEFRGPKGDTGAQGIQGLQGLQGIQGVPGEQGEKGIPGEKGDKGEQGLTGLTGPQGPKGDKGEKGDTVVVSQNLSEILQQGNNANNQKITGVASPSQGSDVANKAYVDSEIAAITSGITTELPPMVFDVYNNDTTTYACVTKDIKNHCGDGDGCKILLLMQHETLPNDLVRTIEERIYLESNLSNNNGAGVHGWTRQQGNGDFSFVLGESSNHKYKVFDPWAWAWAFNYKHSSCNNGVNGPAFVGADKYKLSFMSHPLVKTRFIIFDR